jgi:hypothetical protein
MITVGNGKKVFFDSVKQDYHKRKEQDIEVTQVDQCEDLPFLAKPVAKLQFLY